MAKTASWARSVFAQLGADAVLVMNFNDCSATDLSGYSNHGTLHITYPGGCTDGVPGFTGKALYFDGDDYVEVPSAKGLSVNAITFEFWSKQGSTQSNFMHPIAIFGSHRATVYVVPNTYSYRVKFNNISGINYDGINIGTYDNNWHHFVVVFDGSKIRGYVDGVLKNTVDAPGVINKINDSVYIGRTEYGGNMFNGLIDEVRIYSRALTAFEIQKHYVEGLKRHPLVMDSDRD